MKLDFLAKDVGPLPLWAWLGAGAAGIGIGLTLTRSKGGGLISSARVPTGATTAIVANAVPGGASNVTPGSEIVTNSQWEVAAFKSATGSGISAIAATMAISAYLGERDLTPDQVQIVELVLSRVGLPPRPPSNIGTAPLPPDPPIVDPAPTVPTREVTVAKGETLSGIALRELGDAMRFRELARLSGISNPDRIFPGDTITIPGSAPAPTPTTPSTPSTHTVKSGDTLQSIAKARLGSAGKWRVLFNANKTKISNPNLIQPGQVLVIP